MKEIVLIEKIYVLEQGTQQSLRHSPDCPSKNKTQKESFFI